MKKIVFLVLALVLVVGCGSKDKGELIGAKGKRWHPEKTIRNESYSRRCFYYG